MPSPPLAHPCPYCGIAQRREECIAAAQSRRVMPACAIGPRDDARPSELSAWYKFLEWQR